MSVATQFVTLQYETARDYYEVDLREELAGGVIVPLLLDLAIEQARERTRTYKSPCTWTAEHLGGGQFRVCRITRRRVRKEARDGGGG